MKKQPPPPTVASIADPRTYGRPVPALQSRRPTGAVTWPVILLEGEEKAGKTWAALTLSASERIGDTYVLDLGEGSSDEYGAIPGVDYYPVIHDGDFWTVYDQIRAVKLAAYLAVENADLPVVLIIDSMTDEWSGLKNWASALAAGSKRNQQILAEDPNAEIVVSTNHWNAAADKHQLLMRELLSFPGIVIVTAQGKEVAEMRNGEPVPGKKIWKVNAQNNLCFTVDAWIRMRRGMDPAAVGIRSVHCGMKFGAEPKPLRAKGNNFLEWFIFDLLKLDPTKAHVRDMRYLSSNDDQPAAGRPTRRLPGPAENTPPPERTPVPVTDTRYTQQKLPDRQWRELLLAELASWAALYEVDRGEYLKRVFEATGAAELSDIDATVLRDTLLARSVHVTGLLRERGDTDAVALIEQGRWLHQRVSAVT